ncbi:MAG TPA: hypothetical protein VL326_04220 [Kofleriaceae bacterium]|jgi:hypothetical protein|nr:hypothetical protein [Kofleriaceae bacterium]
MSRIAIAVVLVAGVALAGAGPDTGAAKPAPIAKARCREGSRDLAIRELALRSREEAIARREADIRRQEERFAEEQQRELELLKREQEMLSKKLK